MYTIRRHSNKCQAIKLKIWQNVNDTSTNITKKEELKSAERERHTMTSPKPFWSRCKTKMWVYCRGFLLYFILDLCQFLLYPNSPVPSETPGLKNPRGYSAIKLFPLFILFRIFLTWTIYSYKMYLEFVLRQWVLPKELYICARLNVFITRRH